MIDTNDIKFGAVCTAWFPFVDTADRKLRSVVVVSNDKFNFTKFGYRYKQCIVAMITTVEPPKIGDYHVLIRRGSEEYKSAGLLGGDSYLRLDKLFSTDERGINKFIGKLSNNFMRGVSEKCKLMF